MPQQAETLQHINGQVLLTIAEAAVLMRSTPATLYSYIHYEQFVSKYKIYQKCGNKVLFITRNLLKWIYEEGMEIKKRPSKK